VAFSSVDDLIGIQIESVLDLPLSIWLFITFYFAKTIEMSSNIFCHSQSSEPMIAVYLYPVRIAVYREIFLIKELCKFSLRE